MVTKYRSNIIPDGTVIHGSMTTDDEDYEDLKMYRFILGVVLSVYPCDDDYNRSAQQTLLRKGHLHECTVLGVNDGGSCYAVFENVVITPSQPTGLDDYEEKLPRGTSNLVDGSLVEVNLQHVDPYDLDGDWCVIGFIGGKIDSPFIVRWWPHARNTFDAATSGKGHDGRALTQNDRYFRRVNGVETVVTGEGNIVISTTFANSRLAYEKDPKLGRFQREEDPDDGGSIRINVKPSQTFELTFNKQEDGIGNFDIADEELPQTNPPQSNPVASGDRPDGYLYVDRDQFDLYVPDTIRLTGSNLIELDSETIRAGIDGNTNLVEIEGETIKLGVDAGADPVVLGEKLRDWFNADFEVLSPFGPLKINPVSTSTPVFDGHLSTKSVVE